jgi:hypothetical protein
MKRLKDELTSDLEREAALRLLHAGRPLVPSSLMRRRVRLALASTPAKKPTRVFLRPALAASLVVALLGLASAMTRLRAPVARRASAAPGATASAAPSVPLAPSPPPSLAPASMRAPAPHAPDPALLRAAPRPRRLAPPARSPGSAMANLPTAAPRADAPEPSRAAGERTVLPLADTPAVPTPGAASNVDEISLYVDGLKALRQAQDYRRATALFQLYRRSFPRGSFVEESWALSIEAATALGQSPREEAADYLARFPHGRFRALAEKALSR